ncbi:MAG: HDIG domain-containing protein, partial [Coriobacteriia bacterium]|nr:HDIG domain-containing protein [Coriobacteriia bacterium]
MASLIDRLARLVPRSGPLASPLLQRVLLGLLLVGVATFPLIVQTPPIDLVEGAPAPRTIRANRTVQFVDEAATERARSEAAAAVGQVTVHDTEQIGRSRDQVSEFFDVAIESRVTSTEVTSTPEEIRTNTLELMRSNLPDVEDELVVAAAEMDVPSLQAARTSATQIVNTLLSRRFPVEEMPAVIQQLRESASRLAYTQPVRDVITGVVGAAVSPTLVVDEEATEAARTAAADAVSAIVIVKQAGENIVVEGEVVQADDIEIIRRLGLLEQSGSLPSLLALIGVYALMVGAGGAFIWRYDRQVWDSLRDLAIMVTLLGGMVWATRVVLWWRPEVSVYLLPVPLAAMLATLLLSAREGLIVAVMTSLSAILLGFSGGASSVGTLVWATIAVVAVSFMNDRRALFNVGAALIVAGALVGSLVTLAAGLPVGAAMTAGMWGAIGGLLSAILGYGLLPFFEHAFGVTTDVRLLELANPAHPLLRELMVKAPGTYSHSVMTGNLAETAAEAIGARSLLARAGAYYHDIGKLQRPGFFIENQAGGSNPHDTKTPSFWALIITAQVR